MKSNYYHHIIKLGFLCLFILLHTSCQKKFLDKKSDKALVIPHTLPDLQAILDNANVMNGDLSGGATPMFGEISADDYYLTDATYLSLPVLLRNGYLWNNTENFRGITDWNNMYKQVFYANLTLEELHKISPNPQNQDDWNNIKGSALFYRAYAFYQLAQIFASAYQKSSSANDPGIPLRLSIDMKLKSNPATVEENYTQILNDLKLAETLLPIKALYKTRPSLPAVKAMLARAYLNQANYELAFKYADEALAINSDLLDYNYLVIKASIPVPAMNLNKEIIFHSMAVNTIMFLSPRSVAHQDLISLYTANDLRKQAFFNDIGNNAFTYKIGNYSGTSGYFSGIATDELYLIRAECQARNHKLSEAINDLNTLLAKRWATNEYQDLTVTTEEQVLRTVINERRKELCFRTLRWTDLRRLNQDTYFAKTIVRQLNGQQYLLEPHDPAYVLPIPDDEFLSK